MEPVTLDDRKKELKTLLDRMQARPSHDWSRERDRVAVLQQMIAAEEKRAAHA